MAVIKTIKQTETVEPTKRPATTIRGGRTPQSFYHELVTRPDVRALLARLAARETDMPVVGDDEQQ